MLELPGTPWTLEPGADDLAHAPQSAAWEFAGTATHAFTHFELAMRVYAATVLHIEAPGLLRPAAGLSREALPTAMRRCVAVVEAAELF